MRTLLRKATLTDWEACLALGPHESGRADFLLEEWAGEWAMDTQATRLGRHRLQVMTVIEVNQKTSVLSLRQLQAPLRNPAWEVVASQLARCSVTEFAAPVADARPGAGRPKRPSRRCICLSLLPSGRRGTAAETQHESLVRKEVVLRLPDMCHTEKR